LFSNCPNCPELYKLYVRAVRAVRAVSKQTFEIVKICLSFFFVFNICFQSQSRAREGAEVRHVNLK